MRRPSADGYPAVLVKPARLAEIDISIIRRSQEFSACGPMVGQPLAIFGQRTAFFQRIWGAIGQWLAIFDQRVELFTSNDPINTV